MSLFSPGSGDDTVYLEREGVRKGPYQCSLGPKKVSLFYEELDVEEGDKLIRLIPNKEERYTVLEVHYSPRFGGLSGIPPHYTLSIAKDTAIARDRPASTTTNHINIHGSTGIQIGDHNIQNLQVAMKEVLASIDNADATREEKEDARNKLHAFLAHPLVAAAVGAGLPLALGLLS